MNTVWAQHARIMEIQTLKILTFIAHKRSRLSHEVINHQIRHWDRERGPTFMLETLGASVGVDLFNANTAIRRCSSQTLQSFQLVLGQGAWISISIGVFLAQDWDIHGHDLEFECLF